MPTSPNAPLEPFKKYFPWRCAKHSETKRFTIPKTPAFTLNLYRQIHYEPSKFPHKNAPQRCAVMNRLWNALNRNGGRELLLDTFTYGVAKGIPGILGLLSVVVFLRLVGEAQYGRFALATSIASVWITFSSGWLYQGILRFGSSLAESSEAFRRVLLTGLLFSIGAFLATCLPHLWLQTGFNHVMLAGLAFGGASLIQATLLAELQANLQAKRVLAVELLRSAACFGLAAMLATIMADGSTALLFGTALGYAASVAYASTGRRFFQKSGSDEGAVAGSTSEILGRLWTFGWPISVWLAGQLALPLIDRTMMATQLGLVETGKYAGMSDILTRCFSLAVFPIIQAVYPRIAQLSDNKATEAVRSLLRRAVFLLFLAGTIILPTLYFFRDLIVRFCLPAFDQAYLHIVLPLAAGGFIWQAAILAHKPLELANRTRLMLLAMVAAVILKIIGNYLFLPRFGVLGPALATLLSGMSYCIFCLIFNRRLAK